MSDIKFYPITTERLHARIIYRIATRFHGLHWCRQHARQLEVCCPTSSRPASLRPRRQEALFVRTHRQSARPQLSFTYE
jgi:hypothetical protein